MSYGDAMLDTPDGVADEETSGPDPLGLATLDPHVVAREQRCRDEPWRCPKKPSKDAVLSAARRVKDDHGYRLLVNAMMNQWLNGERFGHFDGDRELIRKGEMVPAPSDDLKNQHFKMVVWHARMQVAVKAYGRAAIDAEEVEAVEDYCRLLYREWQIGYAEESNGGDFMSGLADTLGRTGMLAAYVYPDPTNTRTGLCFHLLDPNSTFYVFEGKRGLKAVYEIRMATAEDVIGDFGDNGGRIERKVRKLVKGEDGGDDDTCEKELICRYDRGWTTVIWGDTLIKQVENPTGEVPVVIQSSGVGMQTFTQTPDPSVAWSDTDLLMMGPDYWRANSRQLDMARQNQPLLWRLVPSHSLKEAIATRYVSAFKRFTWDPPLIIGQTNQSVQDGAPDVEPGDSGRTFVRAEDIVNPFPNMPPAELVAPIQAWLDRNTQTGMPTGMTSGTPGGAQASGNAIDLLNADGYELWTPVTVGIQHFLGKCLRYALRCLRDHGDAYGGEDYPGGLLVPRTKPDAILGLTDPYELTPDVLERVGCEVDVTLRKFNPASLPPLVQSLMMAKQAGLMSQEVAVELIAAAQDVEDEVRRIKEDQLDAVPELMGAEQLDLAYNRAMRATRAGDMESARRQILKAKYLADQLTVAQASRMSMVSQATIEAMGWQQQMGAMGAGGGMPGGGMTPALGSGGGGEMPPGANVAPYQSPSQFGGTTGQVSPGRPQGGQGQMGGMG